MGALAGAAGSPLPTPPKDAHSPHPKGTLRPLSSPGHGQCWELRGAGLPPDAGTHQHPQGGRPARTEKLPETGIHPQAGGIPADRVCAGSCWEVQRGISLWETGHFGRQQWGGGGGRGNSPSAWPGSPQGKFPGGRQFPGLLPDFHSWGLSKGRGERQAEPWQHLCRKPQGRDPRTEGHGPAPQGCRNKWGLVTLRSGMRPPAQQGPAIQTVSAREGGSWTTGP